MIRLNKLFQTLACVREWLNCNDSDYGAFRDAYRVNTPIFASISTMMRPTCSHPRILNQYPPLIWRPAVAEEIKKIGGSFASGRLSK